MPWATLLKQRCSFNFVVDSTPSGEDMYNRNRA